MADTKFTPGPWVHGKPDMFGDFTIQGPKEKLAVASVCNGEARKFSGDWDEHEANAHLIAAAPSLYEALEDLWTWVKNWDVEFLDDDEFDRSFYETALAKARGET